MWKDRSDINIQTEIGNRLKEYRLRSGLQQKELAEKTTLSLSTIMRMEQGGGVSFTNLLRVLRVLGLLENLEFFIPKPPVSPIMMRKMQGKTVKRIKKSKADTDE